MKSLVVVYCLTNALTGKPDEARCWDTRHDCADAARRMIVWTCKPYSAPFNHSQNFNVETTQEQSCIAGGLNPDCTPRVDR